MLIPITEALTKNIEELGFFDRLGGLVHAMPVPEVKRDETGMIIYAGVKIAPISVQKPNDREFMVPDSNRGHIGFFVDNGGHQFAGSIGAKDGEMKFSFNLKFLAWLNLAGANVPESDINHIILPHVIEAVALKNIAVSEEHFENGFRNFKVDNVGVLASNASMFQPFHFFEAGAKAGLFNYPYGYFGLQLVGTFSIARKCLNPSILPKYVAACTPQI